ncbi:hypothetical protein ACFL96_12325 [Thermoproteota archaeon]
MQKKCLFIHAKRLSMGTSIARAVSEEPFVIHTDIGAIQCDIPIDAQGLEGPRVAKSGTIKSGQSLYIEGEEYKGFSRLVKFIRLLAGEGTELSDLPKLSLPSRASAIAEGRPVDQLRPVQGQEDHASKDLLELLKNTRAGVLALMIGSDASKMVSGKALSTYTPIEMLRIALNTFQYSFQAHTASLLECQQTKSASAGVAGAGQTHAGMSDSGRRQGDERLQNYQLMLAGIGAHVVYTKNGKTMLAPSKLSTLYRLVNAPKKNRQLRNNDEDASRLTQTGAENLKHLVYTYRVIFQKAFENVSGEIESFSDMLSGRIDIPKFLKPLVDYLYTHLACVLFKKDPEEVSIREKNISAFLIQDYESLFNSKPQKLLDDNKFNQVFKIKFTNSDNPCQDLLKVTAVLSAWSFGNGQFSNEPKADQVREIKEWLIVLADQNRVQDFCVAARQMCWNKEYVREILQELIGEWAGAKTDRFGRQIRGEVTLDMVRNSPEKQELFRVLRDFGDIVVVREIFTATFSGVNIPLDIRGFYRNEPWLMHTSELYLPNLYHLLSGKNVSDNFKSVQEAGQYVMGVPADDKANLSGAHPNKYAVLYLKSDADQNRSIGLSESVTRYVYHAHGFYLNQPLPDVLNPKDVSVLSEMERIHYFYIDTSKGYHTYILIGNSFYQAKLVSSQHGHPYCYLKVAPEQVKRFGPDYLRIGEHIFDLSRDGLAREVHERPIGSLIRVGRHYGKPGFELSGSGSAGSYLQVTDFVEPFNDQVYPKGSFSGYSSAVVDGQVVFYNERLVFFPVLDHSAETLSFRGYKRADVPYLIEHYDPMTGAQSFKKAGDPEQYLVKAAKIEFNSLRSMQDCFRDIDNMTPIGTMALVARLFLAVGQAEWDRAADENPKKRSLLFHDGLGIRNELLSIARLRNAVEKETAMKQFVLENYAFSCFVSQIKQLDDNITSCELILNPPQGDDGVSQELGEAMTEISEDGSQKTGDGSSLQSEDGASSPRKSRPSPKSDSDRYLQNFYQFLRKESKLGFKGPPVMPPRAKEKITDFLTHSFLYYVLDQLFNRLPSSALEEISEISLPLCDCHICRPIKSDDPSNTQARVAAHMADRDKKAQELYVKSLEHSLGEDILSGLKSKVRNKDNAVYIASLESLMKKNAEKVLAPNLEAKKSVLTNDKYITYLESLRSTNYWNKALKKLRKEMPQLDFIEKLQSIVRKSRKEIVAEVDSNISDVLLRKQAYVEKLKDLCAENKVDITDLPAFDSQQYRAYAMLLFKKTMTILNREIPQDADFQSGSTDEFVERLKTTVNRDDFSAVIDGIRQEIELDQQIPFLEEQYREHIAPKELKLEREKHGKEHSQRDYIQKLEKTLSPLYMEASLARLREQKSQEALRSHIRTYFYPQKGKTLIPFLFNLFERMPAGFPADQMIDTEVFIGERKTTKDKLVELNGSAS